MQRTSLGQWDPRDGGSGAERLLQLDCNSRPAGSGSLRGKFRLGV